EHLDDLKYIAKRANIIQTAEIEYDEHGKVVTLDSTVVENKGARIVLVGQRLPDLVRLIEDQLLASKFPLQLTRPTIAAIIRAIPDTLCKHAIDDPERWARTVAHAIRTVTIEELVKHIGYEPDPEDDWWDADVVFLAEDE